MLIASMYKVKRKIRINKHKFKYKENYVFKLGEEFKNYVSSNDKNEV